jgi:hypothetical protein
MVLGLGVIKTHVRVSSADDRSHVATVGASITRIETDQRSRAAKRSTIGNQRSRTAERSSIGRVAASSTDVTGVTGGGSDRRCGKALSGIALGFTDEVRQRAWGRRCAVDTRKDFSFEWTARRSTRNHALAGVPKHPGGSWKVDEHM